MPSANALKPMRFYTLAGVDEASVHFEAPDLIDGSVLDNGFHAAST